MKEKLSNTILFSSKRADDRTFGLPILPSTATNPAVFARVQPPAVPGEVRIQFFGAWSPRYIWR